MKNSPAITIWTIFFFVFFTIAGSIPVIPGETANDDPVISKLLTDAENNYQNGKFKEAIEIYEQIIIELNKRKELVKTKQKLFTTMVSLALTYFTIQETDKSKMQLEKLIGINPNQKIDEEIYPPRFVQIFKDVQTANVGELLITSTPSGASVSIDNKSIGTTPVNIKKFTKGEYALTLAKKGYNITTQKATVKPGTTNTFKIILEAAGKKKVIEKEGVKKQKKKKVSPILLIGGVVALGAVLLLVLKKKEDPVEQVRTLQFTNNTPVPIAAYLPAYSILEASGITGTIRKVEYSVTIAHPRIEDLAVTLVGTDNRTLYNVWNKGPHENDGKTFQGSTQVFNSVAPNGSWKITVNNSGQRKTGEITRWVLKIYYVN